MKPSTAEITPILGTPMAGGFYAGRISLDVENGQVYDLIVAPKSEGEHEPDGWIDGFKDVPGAKDYNDGLTNTRAMAEAGSDLAKCAMDLRIGGRDDWYIPSQDELEVIYRNLKPTSQKNHCYNRSGINLSAVEQTRPYTPDFPIKTVAEVFQDGGSEAFDADWYWTSTQLADRNYAWCQDFGDGGQDSGGTDGRLRCRVVRRLAI